MYYTRTRYIILLFVLCGLLTGARAQSILSAGDIAITGFNFDADGWSFVVLVPIEGGTEIKFTDNGWQNNNTFRNNEGILTWTAPSGGIFPGTEISITDNVPYSSSLGTAEETQDGGPNLRPNGDQILAYQGTEANPTFIYAINSEQTGWQANATEERTSALPQDLTNGTTAIALDEIDNAVYNCAVNSDSKANLLTGISSTTNWTGSNSTPQTLPPNCSFSVCSYNYGSISGTTNILCGQPATLSITGQTAGATLQWMWKPDSKESWHNANNTTGSSVDYNTSYLGENTQFMVMVDNGTETCYTDAISVNITDACDDINVWTGIISSDWSDPLNWSLGIPRQDTDNVYIGNEYVNEPNTTNGTSNDYALNLYVQEDAILNIIDNAVNGSFEITGDIMANGTINHSGSNPVTIITGGGGIGIYASSTGDMSTVKLVSDGDFDLESDLTITSLVVTSSVFDINTFTLNVLGDVTVSGGTLNLREGNMNVSGNWLTTGGDITFSFFSSATVEFNGTSQQSYSSNGVILLNMVVNNSAGLSLLDDCNLLGKLTLNNGVISTNGNVLRLISPHSADIEGGTSSSFVNGIIRKSLFPAGVQTYVFPVGRGTASTDYLPAEIVTNNLSGPSYLDVSVGTIIEEADNNTDLRLTSTQNGTPIVNVHEDAAWTITPNTQPTSGSYDLKLWINNVAGLEDNKFTILSRPDGSNDYAEWVSYDATTTIPGHDQPGRTVADGYAIKYGLTSFSQKATGSGNSNLPISLLEFYASEQEEEVLLEWATVSEINNDFFSIERSANGKNFETILEIEGAGTSNEKIEYRARDHSPLPGISYYRLKQTDFDGNFSHSKIVAINFSDKNKVSIWPNPAHNTIYLPINISQNTDYLSVYEVTIKNAKGQLVCSEEFTTTSNVRAIDISHLDNGVYFLSQISKSGVAHTKFIKN